MQNSERILKYQHKSRGGITYYVHPVHCGAKNVPFHFCNNFVGFFYWNNYWYVCTSINLEQNDVKSSTALEACLWCLAKRSTCARVHNQLYISLNVPTI